MNRWYPEADLVIRHPKIYTVALTCEEVKQGRRDFPIIEDGGVASKDGRIIAVGKALEMEPLIGQHTQVIDAPGKMLLPGFVESHMHCTWTGNNLRNIDFRPVVSREEVKRLIKEHADRAPDGEWVVGNSWNELVWDDPEPLTLAELDEICPSNPLFCMRTCFHTAMVNSVALACAGITRDTPDPEGGSIGHEPDGGLDGYLFENSAMSLVQRIIAPLSAEQRIESVEAVGAYLNSLGITSAIDANLSFDEMRTYLEAKKQGRLSYRANLMFYLDSAYGDMETHLRRLEEMDCVTGFGDEMLKLNGVKVTLDGIPATYTALMREGYKTRPDYLGCSVWTQEEITRFVCKAQELGWQFGIHAIGDAAEDMALNAFEEADKISPVWDRRHYLIHYQFPRDDQWERMRRLNVGVTVQPTLVSTMGEAPQFYEEQAERIQSPGLMFKNGIICGGGSDSPVVPPDPVMGMYYAITRLDETTGNTLSRGDESKVSPLEALIMWTKNAAFFLHDDDRLGSIEVGNLADFALFPSDFISDDVEAYRTAKVEKTILGGTVVYEA
ncbi:MAG: amidohydrolase [Coriobacteriales bacterium]|jgi:predicted amidohydrolase YtcJ|nr:amidohydrolase [Coriobacteriales bacterium]